MEFLEYPLLHYQDLMLALLKAGEGGEAAVDDAVQRIKDNFARIGDELPVGEQEIAEHLEEPLRHLMAARLLRPLGQDRFRTTARGRRVLEEHPFGVDDTVLMNFAEFRDYVAQCSANPLGAEGTQSEEYDLGYLAFHAGASITDNPFEPDSSKHLNWQNGWLQGRDVEREHRRTYSAPETCP